MATPSSSKISVGLIFGGQSPEHTISLMTAKNVLQAINREKFDPHLIYIDKKGYWFYVKNMESDQREPLVIEPGNQKYSIQFKNDSNKSLNLDIVFPLLHGQLGEDGTIQGLFKMLNIPFVGNDVLGSAISMDKDVIKRLLKQANIRVPEFLVFHRHEKIDFDKIVNTLKLPFFLKPCNAGSSIGVHKIKDEKEFEKALKEVFQLDEKIIIEEFIPGREIECAVLGNDTPVVSLPGEIIPHHEFYTYEAKYFDENGADVIVPAKLSQDQITQFQMLSLQIYKTLCAMGLARIDFFLTEDGKIWVNEINTIPGFTNISMYPKCFEKSGIPYGELIEKLIMFGLEKQRIFGS